MISEQCFREINPLALCRMDARGLGSKDIACKYCTGPGRAIAILSSVREMKRR